jgi:hypothetical protein
LISAFGTFMVSAAVRTTSIVSVSRSIMPDTTEPSFFVTTLSW